MQANIKQGEVSLYGSITTHKWMTGRVRILPLASLNKLMDEH